MSQTSLTFWPDDFLHSLCVFVAAQAAARTPAVVINYADLTQPRTLWRNDMAEEQAAAPAASVMKIYSAQAFKYRRQVPSMNVQLQTMGASDDAVARQIQTLFECFVDGDGLPLRSVTIPAFLAADGTSAGFSYLLAYANALQTPGQISRDTRGRVTWGFNLEIGFTKAS